MTSDLFLNIDAGSINWARAQFALTAIYHWLFVPLTLGLAVIMGICETCWYRTRNTFWRDTAQFWQRLFGINFAMGIATGIILEFEFGTNWSNYSWFVGDIFGAPLAVEGILAFFMESTFVAIMYFGWKKVSPGFHLASTWLTGLGATISAWWILVANSWMQYPVGCEFNPDTMRNEMVSFLDVALSPFAVDKFCHTVISAWIIGAIFVVAVSSWYLMKKRDTRVNPIGQPDYQHEESAPLKLEMPYALSFMATNDIHGYVPGINDILNGYTKPDGTREPSVDEKIQRGKQAINALAAYRKAKKEGVDETTLSAQLSIIKENMPYFGYGYAKDKNDVVPPIPVNFWAFRIMVGLGGIFILFFAIIVILAYKIPFLSIFTRRLLATLAIIPETAADEYQVTNLPSWHYWVAIALVPLAYIASESGWLVAEFGRQPWTIQDMLPTWVAVSDVEGFSVALTFFIFLFLFTLMLAVEISILLKQIKKGPEYTEK